VDVGGRDTPDSDGLLGEFGFEDETWMERLRDAEVRVPLGRLGPYEIREEVNRGGQGIVYRAYDPRTKRTVALKRMVGGTFASAASRRRFEREVEAAASLNHRGIVTIFGVDRFEGQSVLVMEWIEGVPIDTWAAGDDGARRSAEEIVRLVARVADALRHAHQRGVLHRDLKPSNILVDAENEPHVLDFGLAKMMSPERFEPSLTIAGQFMGTPAYASPEQVRGRMDAFDVRSDLYSLGVILYELVAGGMPYEVNGSLAAAFENIERHEPQRVRALSPAVPRDLDAIVAKAIEKAPEDRYQSADGLLEDLKALQRGEPVRARGTGFLYVLGKTVRRHRITVGIATGFVALTLAFGVTMTLLFQRSERERGRTARVQAFLESTLLPEGSSTEAMQYRLVELLANAASRIDRELVDEPEIEARLRETLTGIYAQLWMWDEAAVQARQALPLLRELDGAESERVANMLFLLGEAVAFRGDPNAVALEEQALRIRRSLFGEESIPVAAVHSGLGLAYWRASDPADPERAEASYREAIRIFEAREAAPSLTWAGTNYSFASFLYSQGRLEESAPLFERALALYDELPERAAVHRVRCLETYAYALLALEEWERSENAFRECVLARAEDTVDESLPGVLWQIGLLCERRGSTAEAEECFRGSLEARVKLAIERRAGLRDRTGEPPRTLRDAPSLLRLAESVATPADEWVPSLTEYRDRLGSAD
jgi:tetratricopeptide (TPR) repeat protein/predicted Ser/Thr protein kinase